MKMIQDRTFTAHGSSIAMRRDRRVRCRGSRELAPVARQRSALERVHEHLQGLISYLEALRPRVAHEFVVPGLGELLTTQQSGYRFFETLSNVPGSFGFKFSCAGETCLASRSGPAQMAAHEARLRSFGLKYQSVYPHAGEPIVLVSARVPVELRFDFDPEQDVVVMQSMNLQTLGRRRFDLSPHRIDAATLNALTRSILGKSDALRTLSGRSPQASQPHLAVMQRVAERRVRSAVA